LNKFLSVLVICAYILVICGPIASNAEGWDVEVRPPEQKSAEPGAAHVFSDQALERVIRNALGIGSGDIYASDLAKIEVIEADGKNIYEIDDLSECTNLRELHLNDNRIRNIDALRNCANLEVLHLRGNPMSNLEPISKLTRIRVLVLRGTDVVDLGDLRNLTGMTDLLINHVRVTDLTPIAGMVKMKNLYLNNNPLLADLSAVENMAQLSEIDIRKCPKIGKAQRKWLKSVVPDGCKIVS